MIEVGDVVSHSPDLAVSWVGLGGSVWSSGHNIRPTGDRDWQVSTPGRSGLIPSHRLQLRNVRLLKDPKIRSTERQVDATVPRSEQRGCAVGHDRPDDERLVSLLGWCR